MLEVLGDEYITQHVLDTYRREQREEIFRVYVADALMSISTRETKMNRRYVDLVKDFESPVETRSASDIISGIKDKLNKAGKEG